MLTKLLVSNFALIRKSEIEFDSGLSVITGETGSGKSILLGALKLILGERADYSVIRNKDNKTIVEAEITLQNNRFKDFFIKNDLDFWEQTVLRREINAKGKSRAFINDTPVSLNILKNLTAQLIHIHSQHNTIQLKDKNFQLHLLDVYADNQDLLGQYKIRYQELSQLKKELSSKKENFAQLMKEQDFLLFQLEELEKLDLNNTDFSEKEEQLKNLRQIDELKANYSAFINTLEDPQSSGVLERLKTLQNNISVTDNNLLNLMERLNSIVIELDDIRAEAESGFDDLEENPEDEYELTALIDSYNSALRKHNSIDQDQLTAVFKEINAKVEGFNNAESEFSELEAKIGDIEKEVLGLAKKLSERRKSKKEILSNKISDILADLKMLDAQVEITLTEKELSENGLDDISFLFSPNKGLSAVSIEKAASGGELSRLMLAIHYILSGKQKLPTVIFDEIDTGVSGEVASKIGKHLKKMGANMQLFAITHLPQVAASGDHHFTVEKYDVNGETFSSITKLENDERVKELAKLMSGEEINSAAIKNAQTLINNQL